MFYHYVTFMTPIGGGTKFYRGDTHIMDPGAMDTFTKDLAHKVTLQTGNITPPQAIMVMGWYDLPESVARARWPQDFQKEEDKT